MSQTRCDDCGYALRIHFARDGAFIGCPRFASAAMGRADGLPRITVRVGKAGARKGQTFVAWPDAMDPEDGSILVWNLTTGDQIVDNQYQLQRSTRRADRDKEREAQEEVEYQLGGKVRIVGGNWSRGTGE